MNEPVWVLNTLVRIAHEVSIANFGGADGVRDRALLDSALAKPKNLFACEQPDLCDLAASYSAGIVRNHPFIDGNKRTGFLVGATFLELNGLSLTAREPEATRVFMGLAAGDVTESELAEWFRQHSKRADRSENGPDERSRVAE